MTISVPEDIDIGQCLVGGVKVAQVRVRNDGGHGRFCIMQKSAWPASNFKVS